MSSTSAHATCEVPPTPAPSFSVRCRPLYFKSNPSASIAHVHPRRTSKATKHKIVNKEDTTKDKGIKATKGTPHNSPQIKTTPRQSLWYPDPSHWQAKCSNPRPRYVSHHLKNKARSSPWYHISPRPRRGRHHPLPSPPSNNRLPKSLTRTTTSLPMSEAPVNGQARPQYAIRSRRACEVLRVPDPCPHRHTRHPKRRKIKPE
jgi:hypothetical protein